jgi:hypothetical protein
MLHDRVLNGVNAGCCLVVEANLIHKKLFKDRSTALLFTYDHDDSLRECLNVVCYRPGETYNIATAGGALRDTNPFRFGNFSAIFSCANPLNVNIDPVSPALT